MKARIALLVITCLSLPACGPDRFAQMYAAEVLNMLQQYEASVAVKLLAEEQSYVELAKAYEDSAQRRTPDLIDQDARDTAEKFADSMVKEAERDAASKVYLSDVHEQMRNFVARDFSRSTKLLTREVDSYKQTLDSLASLSKDEEAISKLQKAVAVLAKPSSVKERMQAAKDFACALHVANGSRDSGDDCGK